MTPLVQLLIAVAALLLLPASFMATIWRKRSDDPVAWLLTTLYTGVYIAHLFVAGAWDVVGYPLRYLLPLVYAIVVIRSYRQVRTQPRRRQGGLQRWVDGFVLLVFVCFLGLGLWGFRYDDAPVELAVPFEQGRYIVRQGGNSPLLNYHNPYPPQRYALDITALNAAGLRAAGLYPSELDRYAIFGKTVTSPCDGEVTAAVDGYPDLNPPAADPDNPPGNHVIIHCHGVNVVLAHLQQHSVAVAAGDRVVVGQMLGNVGNSGNTSEPHLHLHAVRAAEKDAHNGEGVPIRFNGRFLVRNAIITVR